MFRKDRERIRRQNKKERSLHSVSRLLRVKVSGLLTGTWRLAPKTIYVTFAYPSNIKNNNSNNHTLQWKQLPNRYFTNSTDCSHHWQANNQSINSLKLE